MNIVVINNLDVATTLHWHGQLQRGSTTMDGVMGITQCAIAPGASMTYTFKADPPGTFWYHSHARDHYLDGLYGPLIIHHPEGDLYSRDYHDQWIWMLADWYNMRGSDLAQWYRSDANPEGTERMYSTAQHSTQ